MYKRVELIEGQPVQFLGVYAMRWPYDSGVEPTVGFIEVDEDEAIAAAVAAEREACKKVALDAIGDLASQDAHDYNLACRDIAARIDARSR